MQKHHPTPWRVAYWRRCPEWHEQSRPQIVDASGCLVAEMPQHVGHPGEYDAIADGTARAIVEAVTLQEAVAPCPAGWDHV